MIMKSGNIQQIFSLDGSITNLGFFSLYCDVIGNLGFVYEEEKSCKVWTLQEIQVIASMKLFKFRLGKLCEYSPSLE